MNESDEPRIPRHVAMIMDGNGRWARERGLPRLDGHRAGAETVERVVQVCRDVGIEYLTLYAFSTENWNRPRAEVQGLMGLLRAFLHERLPEMQRKGIRLNAIGDIERLPALARRALRSAMTATERNTGGMLTLALNYGSRDEITAAVRTIAEDVRAGVLAPEDITPDTISSRLYTCDLPDPDLVIRTSGEYRLSNFLLWQASYAELWVTPTYWPDFSEDEFRQALADFAHRDRRYGGHKDA